MKDVEPARCGGSSDELGRVQAATWRVPRSVTRASRRGRHWVVVHQFEKYDSTVPRADGTSSLLPYCYLGCRRLLTNSL